MILINYITWNVNKKIQASQMKIPDMVKERGKKNKQNPFFPL